MVQYTSMLRTYAIKLISRLSRIKASMTNSCVFCKIVSREAKATIVYSDEQVTAFRDIHPIARTHILIVPNRHIESVNSLEVEDEQLMGHLFTVARQLAKEEGIDQGGYRIIVNTGIDGGQTVFHLHIHLIGGKRIRKMVG
jgi:histidine triad (HIT) family protein